MTIVISDTDDLSFDGVHLFDVTPRINSARVRPFVFATLLLRSAVRASEVVETIKPHAHPDDLEFGLWDGSTRLEDVVSQTLVNLEERKILRSRPDGLYVLANSSAATRAAISIAASLDAQLPDHLLAEMGRQSIA